MFPQPYETIVRHLELVTGDPLAEFEGGALPLTEMKEQQAFTRKLRGS
jgi:hypothetical protein